MVAKAGAQVNRVLQLAAAAVAAMQAAAAAANFLAAAEAPVLFHRVAP